MKAISYANRHAGNNAPKNSSAYKKAFVLQFARVFNGHPPERPVGKITMRAPPDRRLEEHANDRHGLLPQGTNAGISKSTKEVPQYEILKSNPGWIENCYRSLQPIAAPQRINALRAPDSVRSQDNIQIWNGERDGNLASSANAQAEALVPDCVALILDTINGPARASGILIAPRVVLTAAHNSVGTNKITVVSGVDIDAPPPKSQRILVPNDSEHWIVHREFDPETYKHDIMILLLPSDLPYSGFHKRAPANLVSDAASAGLTNSSIRKQGIIAGYGYINQGGRPVLTTSRYRALVSFAPNECSNPQQACSAEREVVTGGLRGSVGASDICYGDSGGPLLIIRPGGDADNTKDLLLAGFISRKVPCPGATASCFACGYGGIQVRIDAYQTWIDTVLSARHISIPLVAGPDGR